MGSVQSNKSLKRKNFFQLSQRGDGRRRSRDLTHQREACRPVVGFEGGGSCGMSQGLQHQQHNRALVLNFKEMNSVDNPNEKKIDFPLKPLERNTTCGC